MNWRQEWKPLVVITAVFLALFYLPLENARFTNAIMEALHLAKWYAQEHVVLCLLPAFFIAGAIAVFVSQASVLKYFGPNARKLLSYGVASCSGTVLAVCSCTVLPLFAGIYRMGAGIGPATAFLYSGPAINILAIILTARILGMPLGIARAVGAIVFSVVIGLLMHLCFCREEGEKAKMVMPEAPEARPLWQTAVYFAVMIGILVFANWGRPADPTGLWSMIYSYKWVITSFFAAALGVILMSWFRLPWWKIGAAAIPPALLASLFSDFPILAFSAGIVTLSLVTSSGATVADSGEGEEEGEAEAWFTATWGFAKQIMPLLFYGVLIAGLLLGRPGQEGLIPSAWVSGLVGGNSLFANFFASVFGAFMYFATLTEVPIVQGLIGSGMGQGPALALLLAGPALSLPNMLVIRTIMGTKKTVIFISLVVVMATISGMAFGYFFG